MIVVLFIIFALSLLVFALKIKEIIALKQKDLLATIDPLNRRSPWNSHFTLDFPEFIICFFPIVIIALSATSPEIMIHGLFISYAFSGVIFASFILLAIIRYKKRGIYQDGIYTGTHYLTWDKIDSYEVFPDEKNIIKFYWQGFIFKYYKSFCLTNKSLQEIQVQIMTKVQKRIKA